MNLVQKHKNYWLEKPKLTQTTQNRVNALKTAKARRESIDLKIMKRTIAKNTLSFMTSATYTHIRTPKDIWAELIKEFDFTLDACASDENHLCDKYYTEEDDCLKQDWTGEVVYCHPMFNMFIGKFVGKAANSQCLSVLLLPAATHTRYFHKYIWDKQNHCPRLNTEVRFLEKPKQGFCFGNDNGSDSTIPKGKVGYIKPLMIVIFRRLV